MNQTLKDRFYSIGTKRHIKYVAAAGGMTEEEAAVLSLLNEKRDDQYIMDSLSIDKNRLQALEKNVGTKTACAILHAIDFCIQFDPI